MQISPDSIEILNDASFEHTDRDLFIETTAHADELTDVITKFKIDVIVKKAIKQIPQ